jgi:hypothetical protein
VNQVLAIAFNHVFRTGTMQNACEWWTSLNPTNKTWAHFQTMFTQAHETYKSLTAQTGGYHGANNAYIIAPITQSESFDSESADAFANLAMSSTTDKDLLSTITTTNAALTGILREKDSMIATLRAQLRGTNTATPATPVAPATPASNNTANTNYWWSNGTRVSKSHTSAACLYPKEGHKKEATRANRMGGKDAWNAGPGGNDKIKTNLVNNLTYYAIPVAHKNTAIMDSGCTTHYLKRGVKCTNIKQAHIPIKVNLPNGSALRSTATSDVMCHKFNQKARAAHVINGLQHSLLPCGQMCDAGYNFVVDSGEAKVINRPINIEEEVIMSSKRDTTTGLCTLPLDHMSATTMGEQYRKWQNEMSNNVYKFTNIYDATQYLYTAAFSPVKSTFLKAIDAGNFATWPTLTAQHVNKYLEKSEASIKGHMNQQRKNVRCTQQKDNAEELDEQE